MSKLTEAQAAWIQKQLRANNYTLSGDIVVTHERAWSSVATVPTTSGKLYFKVTRPELVFEVRLTEALYQWGMPVPAVIGAEAEQGWLLIRDGGQSLRSLLQANGDIERWQRVVTQYARMQIALIDRADVLLAMGVLDRRLSQLPALYAGLLQDKLAMMMGHEDGLTATQYDQLQQLVPQFSALCRQLATFGIPETLHHDDFHDNNIFVRNNQYTFADWGEACIAHPFFSMIIVLRIAAYILKLEDDDPALAAIRDTYLAQWQAYGTPAALLAAFNLAHTVGAANRALTWHTMLGFMNEAERAEEAGAVPGWLQEFLKAT